MKTNPGCVPGMVCRGRMGLRVKRHARRGRVTNMDEEVLQGDGRGDDCKGVTSVSVNDKKNRDGRR